MKKYITALFLLLLLSSNTTNAQEADTVAIKKFLYELEKLDGQYVTYEKITKEKLLNSIVVQVNEQTDNALGNLDGKDIFEREFTMVNITSEEEAGYNKLNTLLEHYDAYSTEELFGIPLTANQREDGTETIVFMNDNHSIMINNFLDEKEIEILYCDYNLMEIIQNILVDFVESIEENIDNSFCGALSGIEDVNFSLSLFGKENITINGRKEPDASQETKNIGCSAKEILSAVESSYDSTISRFENSTKSNKDEIQERINELKEEKEAKLAELTNTLNSIDVPSFIQNPLTKDVYVAIPTLTEELSALRGPHAENGIYDWITSTGFGKSVANNNTGQECAIITPKDILQKYATEYYPETNWTFCGYPTYKETFVTKYQGGTPAVLYRKSIDEKGYNLMLADIGHLFNLKLGESHKNMKVTQNSRRESNGNRFVRLYGEDGTTLYLLDLPGEQQCLMTIIIGHEDFENAVNDCKVGEEENIADKYNIIINENGIRFSNEEYYYYPKKHKNGVHIDFGFAIKYTKE